MPDRRKAWRYEVTDVTGSMTPNLSVGEIILDYWHGKNHTYTIMDRRTAKVTGTFSVRLLGQHDRTWDEIRAEGGAGSIEEASDA